MSNLQTLHSISLDNPYFCPMGDKTGTFVVEVVDRPNTLVILFNSDNSDEAQGYICEGEKISDVEESNLDAMAGYMLKLLGIN